MMNLFSIFDPSTSKTLSLNWFSTMMFILFIPHIYWMVPSRIHFMWSVISLKIHSELNTLFSKNKNLLIFIFISIFWFIMVCNFLGLFPYVFTPTSHINLTSFLAVSLWLTFMLYGWITQTNHMFSHMVPIGTPIFLSLFMVCIETISNLIRPLTLAVRLTANMISGHLLLCLLSNIMQNFSSINLMVMPFMMILLLLEMAVAVIQSYVFITLTSLYLNEIN
uniref:ATP synthase subunit a n=1 Tax=Ornithodoros hermsi TaxID=303297 RepID=A0A3G2K022_9ACAR|nr:ATP synthase F0 subunit 6 [Ornithodoros hermsi]AYN50641.1 ATP synthase F0 subunit 6 [Ornithodoros hermsi]UYB78370.1 ATP synthase F0 subunit 6 [Ornithodoros hermsi]